MSHQRLSIALFLLLSACLIATSTGCSSLGLSGWPAQFHLTDKAKEFAALSPLPSGLPHELNKRELGDYFLEPGDRILIEPTDLDSEIGSLGDQKIQVDGSVDLGEFGRIRVTGMTVEAVEAAVEDQIGLTGITTQMNVRLIESNAQEVYVLGEVGSPAAYSIDGHEHVLDAILRAGGLTSKASACDIILVRPTSPEACRVVLPVCYRQITQLGDVTTNYQLQPGDRIVVGSRRLSEELSFWKQDEACERCCRSCCVECKPEKAIYRNRFLGRLLPFLNHSRRPVVETMSNSVVEVVDEKDDAADRQGFSVAQPASERDIKERTDNAKPLRADDVRGKSDKDLFLLPLEK